ncbi:hypothetical protein [Streptomyces sp. 4F14]|uniref:hypothetical protein n=1 Tax=Streptomyces sp. 4F14 TaxID=3394380 RepID=UPI003A855571
MPVAGTTWGKVEKEYRPWRVRGRGALLVLIGGLSAFVGYAVFVLWMPASAERYDDYRAASTCAGPLRAENDCLRTVPLRVDGIERRGKGARHLTATMTEAPFWSYRTDFGDPGPLVRDLGKGDEITGTTWRGDLVAVARGEVRQHTSDEPRDEPQPQAALGTYASLLAGLLLVRGADHLVRPRRHPRFPTRRLALGVGAVAGVVGILAVWTGVVWWLTPPLILLTAAPLVYLILNWDTPQKRAPIVGSGTLPPS